MPTQKLRSVETASRMMRRYYQAVKETMRAQAGYLAAMRSWEAKKLISRHIWIDATHADMLRTRTLELRFPRVDVDEADDQHLMKMLGKLPTAPTDADFLSGVYHGIKPQILQSIQTYIDNTDPLDDAPSLFYMRRIADELQQQMNEYENIFAKEPYLQADTNWTADVKKMLTACGGTDGPDQQIEQDPTGFMQRPDFEIPMEAGRDPSWEPAVMQVSPRAPRNFTEKQLHVGIDHANELWAAETPAAIIWTYKDVDWELKKDAARWCYDEMRHSMMGVRRLADMGLEVGVDYPMVPDHWKAFRQKGLKYLLLLLHHLEHGGPKNKAALREEFTEKQDFAGAQDCDFDWADEAGHLKYGFAWNKVLFPEWDKTKLIEEGGKLVQEWVGWMQQHHREGTHGYEIFLQRQDAKLVQKGGEQS